MRKIIPNLMTLLNLASGFLAIIFSFKQDFLLAAICLLVAVAFDFFDGLFARLLKAESKMGAELDSLADIVSFGVAPAIFMFAIFPNTWLLIILTLLVLAGAFRLARFNVLKTKVKGFVGMPITVNGVLFPVLYFLNASIEVVMILAVVSIILMISSIRFKKVT